MVEIPNIFAQGMGAYDDQTKRLRAAETLRASKQAGSAIASGDYTGGANVFNQAGMVEEGHNVLADQQVIQDRQTAAANTAADRARQSQQIKLEGLSKITDMVASQPAGTRAAYVKQHIPLIQDLLGADPGVFANMTEDQLSDQELAGFKAYLGKAQADFTLTHGQTRFNGQGKPIASVAEEQKYMPITAGGALVPIPNGNAPPAPAPAPVTTTAPAAAAAAPVDASAPRGLRNNNPLNLTPLPQGQWAGQSGTDGRYATFGTPEAGMAAADKNLQAYATHHGINTLTGIVARWAPAGDGANDPKAYAATVGADIGVDPNQPLNLADPKVRAVVLHSMAKVENGRPVPQASGAPPVAQAPPADGLPPGTIRGPAKPPVWTPDGHGNLINENGDRKVDPTYDGAGAADPNIVKMVLDGRYPPPTGRAATDPKWQAVLQAASAQDPSFNAADYHTRYATRKDFTSGKAAQNITALNTALGHIGDLDGQIAALKNGPIPMANQVGNWFASETGDPRVKQFDTTKKAVVSELVKVFRQTGGSEQDMKDFQGPLDAAGSPAQLHAVTREMTKLLSARLDALSSQYQQGLGQTKDGREFLTPKAQAVYDRLLGHAPASAPAAPGTVIRYDAHGNRVQ